MKPLTADERKQFRQFMANRRRAVVRKPAPEMVVCADGPFAGHQLAITRMGDGWTASFRVGDWFGAYHQHGGKLHWIGNVPMHARGWT